MVIIMKRFVSTLLALSAAIFLAIGSAPAVYAENPISGTAFTPDPAPMVSDGVLYVYTGEDSEEDNGFYNMTAWRCYSTTDMVNWTDHGQIMRPEDFEWADPGSAWACQCVERGGKFYLYVTVTNSGGRNIGVAVSDSPTGPFKDAIGGPLCGPNWYYIDPTVMIDDDGQAYLYFGNPTAYYCKLNEDMISLDGEIMAQDMTKEAFGFKPFESDAPSSYTEGPWIYKRDGLYYLVYASQGVPEGISYSTSDSPTGPWDYRGVIMEPGNSTTIHPGIIDYKGHSYFFYHGVYLPNGGWNKRSCAVMEFSYNSDGSIPMITHSDAGVKQLENFDPFGSHCEAETMSASDGMVSVTDKDGVYITARTGDGYIKLSGVDFGNGAKSFSADVSASGGSMEIHLDAQDGKKIGSLNLSNIGKTEALGCNLSENSGVHDLYFVFKGASDLCFNNWQFGKNEISDPAAGVSLPLTTIILAVVCMGCAAVAGVLFVLKNRKK